MTIAEIRFRFINDDNLKNYQINYTQYLKNKINAVGGTYNEIENMNISKIKYIEYLENRIVELTENKKW